MSGRTAFTRSRLVLLLLPLALLVGACSGPSAPPAEPAGVDAGLARFYQQQPGFGSCADYAPTANEEAAYATNPAFQCARVEVPLDYGNPQGETARIAIMKVPARGEKIGSLLLNAGGPGGPGLPMAAAMATALATSPLTERFDLIGVDPRGVGASIPAISCFTDLEQDDDQALYTLLGAVGEWDEAYTRGLVQKCADGSGGRQVLAHVGTRDAARDMDVLRAVLGDEKLSFLGQSYGTRLGAVYAEMFPDKVRALVLDGAVDPKLGTAPRKIDQYVGFQQAFDRMAIACAAKPSCPLGTDPSRAVAAYQGLTRPLLDAPVTGADGRPVTYNVANNALFNGLYAAETWPVLWAGIAELRQGKGNVLLSLNDAFGGRDAAGKWSNFNEAFYAISCMDEDRRTPEQEAELRAKLFAAAPILDGGRGVAGSRDGCEAWPAAPTLGYPYAQGVTGVSSLVVASTGDPATPYQGGVSLAESLGADLLTVQGDTHIVVAGGTNACVNGIVADYLVQLRRPAPDARCTL